LKKLIVSDVDNFKTHVSNIDSHKKITPCVIRSEIISSEVMLYSLISNFFIIIANCKMFHFGFILNILCILKETCEECVESDIPEIN
jgi:hypothetical protein